MWLVTTILDSIVPDNDSSQKRKAPPASSFLPHTSPNYLFKSQQGNKTQNQNVCSP